MKGEWCYFKSAFSKEHCNSIIQRSKNLNFYPARMGEDGSTNVSNHRKSDIVGLNKQIFSDVYDMIWELEKIANQQWFDFIIDDVEEIQMARYDGNVGGEYKRHQDTFWVCNSKKHRKITAVIQLSDPNEYQGGDLVLFDCLETPNYEDIRQQGSVIFFPSFIFHQANPVLSGTRYSLACWFSGPKFR